MRANPSSELARAYRGAQREAMSRRAEQELVRAERRRRVIALRLDGCTFSEIADNLGMRSRSSARKLYLKALADTYRAGTDEARQLELQRLDALQRRWWPKAIGEERRADGTVLREFDPDWRATRQVLRIMQLRCELLGLFARPPLPPPPPEEFRKVTIDEVWCQVEEYQRHQALHEPERQTR